MTETLGYDYDTCVIRKGNIKIIITSVSVTKRLFCDVGNDGSPTFHF